MDEAEVRRLYEQMDADPERYSEDFVLNRVPVPGTEPTLRGRSAIAASNAEITELFEDVSITVDRVEELPDGRWVVLFTLSGRGKGSGAPSSVQMAHISRVNEDGITTRIDTHATWEEAMRAAEKESW